MKKKRKGGGDKKKKKRKKNFCDEDIDYQVMVEKFLREFPYADPFTYLGHALLQEKIAASEARYEEIDIRITDQAFLWRAEKTGFAPVYIFNTCHYLIDVKIKDIFGDAIKNTVDQVQVVFTEVEIDVHSDKKTLSSEKHPTIYHLDEMVAKKAYAMRKTLKPLETSEIRNMLGGGDQQEQQIFHKEFNAEIQDASSESFTFLTEYSKNYLTHVCPSYSLIELDRWLIKRNKFWMMSILEESSKQNPSLVVCGAIHSRGQFGLPNLLAHEGYTVKPLMKTAPTPKSVMLKEVILTGSSSLFFRSILPKELKIHANEQNLAKKNHKF